MRTIILFLSIILLTSCGESEETGTELETTVPELDTSKSEEPQEEVITIVPGGKHMEYHPNGQIKIEGQYDMESKRTGLWISYYENGTKWSESFYTAGIRNGHTVSFFPNGRPRYVGEYLNDEKTAVWTFYDEEGNTIKEEDYTSED